MKTTILFFTFLLVSLFGYSQKYSSDETKHLKTYYFEHGFVTPAKKKISTLVLKDGNEVQGKLNKIKFKKNHIDFVSITDSISGKAAEYPASTIKDAYFFPSSLERLAQKSDNAMRIQTRKISKKRHGDEAYFESCEVGMKNKKKKGTYLLQLLNPDFDSLISVYFNPTAKESSGADIGAMLGGSQLKGALKVGGGVLESYYVKKGDRIVWLNKKNLKKEYDFLFGDNPEFIAKYPYKAVKWNWISALVLEYDQMTTGKKATSVR